MERRTMFGGGFAGGTRDAPLESRAPRGGLLLMAIILVAMALLAIYSNVQKAQARSNRNGDNRSRRFAQVTPSHHLRRLRR